MTETIERVLPQNFQSGKEKRRRWYRITGKTNRCLGLDLEELRYLSICREMASPILPTEIADRVDSTIFDLSVSMLNPTYQSSLKNGKKSFSLFSKGRIDYSNHTASIETVLTAIEKCLVCDLAYKAKNGKAKPHLFAPARMASMNHALYVMGATVEPDGRTVRHYITIALHRIKSISLTDTRYEIDFPEANDSAFGLPWHEPRQYRIHVNQGGAASYVKERIWSDDQQILEQPDGSIILTITSQSEPELLSWVNSFGGAAKIISGIQAVAEYPEKS